VLFVGGIPTVLDRWLQQAIHQILSPLWEGEFSAHSYGFRPGRSAAQAVKAAQGHIQSGKRWVVDLDLEKFFDRVNHDVVMARVARKVKDGRMLKLIRRYLESGIMQGGVVEARSEGTPQGGPLSPVLSNILLDDLDKELEKRGHRFCRYADDCNIYVGSRRAGERVMASLSRFLQEQLKLTVNPKKSAVDRPWKRKFLGFSMTAHRKSRIRVAPQAVERFKGDLREKFRQGRGRNLRAFLESLKPKLRAGPVTSASRKRELYLKTSTSGCGASCGAWSGGNGRSRVHVCASLSPWDWIGREPGKVPSMAVARGGMQAHRT